MIKNFITLLLSVSFLQQVSAQNARIKIDLETGFYITQIQRLIKVVAGIGHHVPKNLHGIKMVLPILVVRSV